MRLGGGLAKQRTRRAIPLTQGVVIAGGDEQRAPHSAGRGKRRDREGKGRSKEASLVPDVSCKTPCCGTSGEEWTVAQSAGQRVCWLVDYPGRGRREERGASQVVTGAAAVGGGGDGGSCGVWGAAATWSGGRGRERYVRRDVGGTGATGHRGRMSAESLPSAQFRY